MNWNLRLLLVVLLMLTVGAACAYTETGEEIPLSKVPKKVLEAARKGVPDIKLTEAGVEKTRKGLTYELDGTLDGKEYEIEVSADGKVLEIEQEDNKNYTDKDKDTDDEEDD